MSSKKTPRSKQIQLSILMGGIALLLHGSVTFYVNREHGIDSAIQAAIVQGGICFLATLSSAWLMQFFFQFGKTNLQRFFFAGLGGGGSMFALMAGVHTYNNTPELFRTLGSAALLASPYYLLFPLFLIKQRNRQLGLSDDRGKFFGCPYSTSEFLLVLKNNIFGPSTKNRHAVSPCPNPLPLNSIDCQLKIGFIGDLMPLRNKQFALSPELLQFLKGIDYLVANFEGSLYSSSRKNLLAQSHEPDIIDLLRTILPPEKIILSCANNHSGDFGEENFRKNWQHLEKLGFKLMGSKESPSVRINKHLEITAATEWSNQKAEYLSRLQDIVRRQNGSQPCFQVLYPHWCYELELYPNQAQINRAQELLTSFDLIVGHHSHAPSVVACHKVQGKEKMIAYSLGDFSIAIGAGFKNYAWGQALVVEFGPKYGEPPDSPWRQGTSNWCYTTVVPQNTKNSEKPKMLIDTNDTCPWFS